MMHFFSLAFNRDNPSFKNGVLNPSKIPTFCDHQLNPATAALCGNRWKTEASKSGKEEDRAFKAVAHYFVHGHHVL